MELFGLILGYTKALAFVWCSWQISMRSQIPQTDFEFPLTLLALKELKMFVRDEMVSAGTAGWQTRECCSADWMVYDGWKKTSCFLRNALGIVPKPNSWGWMHRGLTWPSLVFTLSLGTTKTLAMSRPLAYCVYQAQQQTEVICQIPLRSLYFQK